MADEETTPTSGESSGTSEAASDAADVNKQILERLEALGKTQENQRSLHDRQMNEIRQAMTTARNTGQDDDVSADVDTSDPAPSSKLTQGRITAMRDHAITKFKVDHPDWQEYWKDIETVGGDTTTARKFLRYGSNPDTGQLEPDFYSSLVDIREHVEMQRLKKQIEDNKTENKDADARTNLARADAGAIGGAPASIPQEVLGEDYKKLSYKDKVKKLVELGLIEMDPSDPSDAMR